MSAHRVGMLVAALALLAGCGTGGSGSEPAGAPEPVVSDPAALDPVEPGTPTAAPDPAEPGTPTAGPDADAAPDASSQEPTVLQGRVGTPEDPEAFVISLTDESGQEVDTLPPGDYVIEVDDPATLHNFHLTGGSVDESTPVEGTVETTFEVTLEPGEYTYRCDPHPSMTGTFTVG